MKLSGKYRDESYKLRNKIFAAYEINENAEIQIQINFLCNDLFNLIERLNLKLTSTEPNDEKHEKAIRGLNSQIKKRAIELRDLMAAYNKRIQEYPQSFVDISPELLDNILNEL